MFLIPTVIFPDKPISLSDVLVQNTVRSMGNAGYLSLFLSVTLTYKHSHRPLVQVCSTFTITSSVISALMV